jgi:hypothetical protein
MLAARVGAEVDAAKYRAKAVEIRQRAQTAQDPIVLQELLALAAEYERLAEETERRERERPDRG